MVLMAVLLAMLAGVMNGSYAFPVKTIKRSWSTDLIWLVFSIFTFLCMPWLLNLLLNAQFVSFLFELPHQVLYLELLAGVVFGFGMALFTVSLNTIGIGLSFLLNIGTSTVIATLLPILLRNQEIFTHLFGVLELLAMAIFVLGIVFAIKSAVLRHRQSNASVANLKGVTFGVLSGVLTAGQGFAYAYALPTIKQVSVMHGVSALSAANISWICLFNGAFVPYALFFFMRVLNNTNNVLKSGYFVRNVAGLLLMAVLYFVCLILFSKSTLLLGHFGGVISWPLFMIFIILTSNFWGFVQGEWSNAGAKAKQQVWVSILLMIVAVLILACNGYLNH